MLVEKLVGAPGARRVGGAFGFAAAEPRAIGLGVFCRLLALAALPEALQIDNVPDRHALKTPQARDGANGWQSRYPPSRNTRSQAQSSFQEFPVNRSLIAEKSMFRSAKTKIIRAPTTVEHHGGS